MRKLSTYFWALPCVLIIAACEESSAPAMRVDVLIRDGIVFDGSGSPPRNADVAIRGDRIVFVGDSSEEGIEAERVVDAEDRWVTPGFVDMHSHAELDEDYGRDAAPYLYQGITTVVVGVDGGGSADVAQKLAMWRNQGIGVNALTYVGHGAVRRAVLGEADRAPSEAEFVVMEELIAQGMREGAFGLSTGLFYVPGAYATTEEVVRLTAVAARFPNAIYDTHDRDLGAAYNGIGYDASVAEGVRIAEETGIRAIFSHYNLQGAHNYGRGDVGARYINEARARGVDVWAAQHPYDATQSNLRAYTIPPWAAAGGKEAMIARFDDPDDNARIVAATMEMLETRGGADKILLVDERPELNGRTLADYAAQQELPVHEAVQAILRIDNATVMNLELYDHANTRRLAQEAWMMTCTDGRTPRPDQAISHPRTFGAFPMKVRLFVEEESVIDAAFALRSFSGLAADFLRLSDRGYLRPGYAADVVVLDPSRYRDRATYESPKVLAEGVEQLLVNGRFAIRDGQHTGELHGIPLLRPETD